MERCYQDAPFIFINSPRERIIVYILLLFHTRSPFRDRVSRGFKGGSKPSFFCSCSWSLFLFVDRSWLSFLGDITIRGFFWTLSGLAPPRSRGGLSSHSYRSAGDPEGAASPLFSRFAPIGSYMVKLFYFRV
jgi:hypothetical protein